jgi:dynein heavy chain
MAGQLKRTKGSIDISEDTLLIKAMIDSNLPKFLEEDIPLFNALV